MPDSTQLKFEGALSEPLRAMIEIERRGSGEVANKVVQMIVESVPDYGLSSDPRMIEDLMHSARVNVELWFSALLDSTAVNAETIDPITAFARRRVHQGISLTGLLRAFRVIVRAIWIQMLERVKDNVALERELVVAVSPYLLKHFDVVAEAIASSYLQEQSQYARWRDRLRQELWSVIYCRPDDTRSFGELGAAIGLAIEQPHCAVALKLSADVCSRPERFIDTPLVSMARKLKVQPESLMRVLHRDHLVIWIPQPTGQPAIEFEKRLAACVNGLCNLSQVLTAAGVGLPGVGPHGWRASMEQGLRAFGAGDAANKGGVVYRYSRVMIHDAIQSIGNVAEFVRSSVDALSNEPSLLETLQTYFKHGLHRKEAANMLGIHPNTLDNRLSRIEVLLDGSFSDVNWIGQVHAAIRLHHK